MPKPNPPILEPVRQEDDPQDREAARIRNDHLKEDYYKAVKQWNRTNPWDQVKIPGSLLWSRAELGSELVPVKPKPDSIPPSQPPNMSNGGANTPGTGNGNNSGGNSGGNNSAGGGATGEGANPYKDFFKKQREQATKVKAAHAIECLKGGFAEIIQEKRQVVHSAVMMPQQFEQIVQDWEEVYKIPKDKCKKVAFDIAYYCYHNGSSDQAKFQVPLPSHTEVLMEEAVRAIKNHVTLRNFANYFAPVVWNYGNKHDEPPTGWERKKVPFAARFAAFDTFAFVTAAAAYPEDLIREPTDEERQAHAALSALSIDRNKPDKLRTYDSMMVGAEVSDKKLGLVPNISS